eukprot:1505235-Prorocentrum_lima.AAC.1
MTSSLVGSEMCIRDSTRSVRPRCQGANLVSPGGPHDTTGHALSACQCPVSYTHLTLPTICSV